MPEARRRVPWAFLYLSDAVPARSVDPVRFAAMGYVALVISTRCPSGSRVKARTSPPHGGSAGGPRNCTPRSRSAATTARQSATCSDASRSTTASSGVILAVGSGKTGWSEVTRTFSLSAPSRQHQARSSVRGENAPIEIYHRVDRAAEHAVEVVVERRNDGISDAWSPPDRTPSLTGLATSRPCSHSRIANRDSGGSAIAPVDGAGRHAECGLVGGWGGLVGAASSLH